MFPPGTKSLRVGNFGPGPTQCDTCSNGTFTATDTSSACADCPAGFFGNETVEGFLGPTGCFMCDAGKFAEAAGLTTCGPAG